MTVAIYCEPTVVRIRIETEQLILRSVEATAEDAARVLSLYADPKVMEKFAEGIPRSPEYVAAKIATWRGLADRLDPFHALLVFKKTTGEFIGRIILEMGDHPGQAEIGYIFAQSSWGRGYGKEAAKAVVQCYAPTLARMGYQLDGQMLTEIVATSRLDNPGSTSILTKHLQMHHVGNAEKYGAQRGHYSLTLDELFPTETLLHTILAFLALHVSTKRLAWFVLVYLRNDLTNLLAYLSNPCSLPLSHQQLT